MGCGLSSLIERLYELGINNLYGIDFVEKVIELNQQKFENVSDKINFYLMDAQNTQFEDQ